MTHGRSAVVPPITRPLATLAAVVLLSGCVSYAPVASNRPMNVVPTAFGQSEVLQDYKRIQWEDAVGELERVDVSAEEARAASRWARGGSVAWLGGAGLVGLGLGAMDDSRVAGWALLGGGVAALVGGAWGASVGTRHMAAAVSRYNGALPQPQPAPAASSRVRVEPWLSAVTARDPAPRPVVGARVSF